MILVLLLLIALIGVTNAVSVKDNVLTYMDLFKDGVITEDEVTKIVLDYMAGRSNLRFEDVCDACYVYIHWNGKPKTVVDSANNTITIYRPIKRIVALAGDAAEALVILGAKDKVVGVSMYTKRETRQFPELSKLPSVGTCFNPDIEAIVSLHPDIVITYVRWPSKDKLEDKLRLIDPNIKVVRFDFYKGTTMVDEFRKLGYLLDKTENATKYIEWFEKWVNFVKERSPKGKVKVYTCGKPLRAFGEGSGLYILTVMAGGRNVLEGKQGYFDIEAEQLLVWSPDVIIRWTYGNGYETNDTTKIRNDYLEIVEFPGWENVPAVKNGRVYVIDSSLGSSPAFPAALVTVAKWLYPEVYRDVDPRQVFQEYIDNFLHLEFNVSKEGVFVYPSW